MSFSSTFASITFQYTFKIIRIRHVFALKHVGALLMYHQWIYTVRASSLTVYIQAHVITVQRHF